MSSLCAGMATFSGRGHAALPPCLGPKRPLGCPPRPVVALLAASSDRAAQRSPRSACGLAASIPLTDHAIYQRGKCLAFQFIQSPDQIENERV